MQISPTDKIQDNVFGFEDAEDCICTLWAYQHGHSQLQIKIYSPKSDKDYIIHFVGVEYFSCDLTWRGANFNLHSQQDCTEFLIAYRSNYKDPVDKLINSHMMWMFNWKLFSLSPYKGKTIQIVALVAEIVETDN